MPKASGISTLLPTQRSLEIAWPWWIHPGWALVLLTGLMALLSILLPAEAYAEWREAKYLVGDLPGILLLLILVFFVGILVASGMSARGGAATFYFSEPQISYLVKAYRVLFVLTVVGYGLWFLSAISQGVSAQDLLNVLGRDEGAISALKANSRPIGGVTTATQFGPVAIAIGVVLHKLGEGRRFYWWLVALSAVRATFYAERLALIETLLPILLLAALTARGSGFRASLVRLAPLIAPIGAWGVFAAFEYSRSWVYYQTLTPLPFEQWVSLRLAGYYVTSFNNSALMVDVLKDVNSLPYFAVDGFWNFPLVSAIYPHPGMGGMNATDWWAYMLKLNSNPEFNNTGSFLVAYAEFGIVWAAVFWLMLGLIVGAVFARLTKGSLPALLSVATLFVGILELSRFTYWTQGRAFPIFLAIVIISITYPRLSAPGVIDHSVGSGGTSP